MSSIFCKPLFKSFVCLSESEYFKLYFDLVLGRLRQEDQDPKATMSYIVRRQSGIGEILPPNTKINSLLVGLE